MFTATADSAESPNTADSATIASNSVGAHIGNRLRIRRTSHGMNREELSELVGVNPSNLAAYEAGAQRINASLLLRIAKVLDVRPEYFFRGYTEKDWRRDGQQWRSRIS
jgi:transcriptional regulator with XRE-family HTH domain